MFTDMVGYTALGQRNESLSIALLEEQRKLLRPIFNRHGGKEIKTMGDSFLVEFSNALDAARCAYDIQRGSREFNISRPSDQRIRLRIGVHLGDVVQSQRDISGDAVNVASRIQELAEDGGVCVTRQIYDQVQNKFDLEMKNLGPKSLKNVGAPVEVYKMVMPWEKESSGTGVQLDPTRVAVLPFANMSPDPSDSYFADGVTDEIISTLSGVSGLSVISSTSVISYKATTKKAREIGNELEAGSVVEGSVRKAGNKIRVTTKLIAVSSDKHVWAQSYDRNLDDVFEVQTDIAKQVAEALRVRILAPEIDRIDRKPTENTTAYTLYLKGRYHWNRRSIEDLKRATEYFEQAIREDQNFALAYVGLADCSVVHGNHYGAGEEQVKHERAKAMINKALKINPSLAEAHATNGAIMQHDLDLKNSEKEFRTAIALKPSYATAHQWFFHLLTILLRWDEALREIEKAVELDPLSQIINTNQAAYYTDVRNYPKAADLYRKAIDMDPSYADAHFELAQVYGRMKMFDEMKHEFKTGVGLIREAYPHAEKSADADIAIHEGDRDRVRRLLPEIEAHLGEPFGFDALQIAGVYFFLAENDKGFQWLETSYSRKEFVLPYIRSLWMFDEIRTDPRYQNLLGRIGLE